jgi:hypothetical protein
MKMIVDKADMIEWAKGCNKPMTTDEVCKAQDVYGLSYYNVITDLFTQLNNEERALVLVAVRNTMHHEEMERLIVHYAKVKAQQIVNEEMEYYNNELLKKEKDLADRQYAFRTSMKSYWRKITDLKATIRRLENKTNRLEHESAEWRAMAMGRKEENKRLEEKASAYLKIKELLSL